MKNPFFPASFNNLFFFKILLFSLAILFSLLIPNCIPSKQDIYYEEAARNSVIDDIDLILVGEPYAIIDEKWLATKKTTTYKKENLQKQVERYGGSWENFQEEHKDTMKIEGELVFFETEGTSHFTNYDYDRKIPIIFYGSKFFQQGIYKDRVFQQHIVPTIAKLIDSPLPSGVRLNPLPILKSKPDKAEVILTIVIDQGGIELYQAHPGSYPNIHKLMNNGAYFPNAEVGHLDAHTGVGHVAIGTGAFPKDHKIIANSKVFIESDGNKLVYIEKKLYESDARVPDWKSIDPTEMKTETLADVWDLHRSNKPVIISQCYAVRASIGMAGHGSVFQSSSGYNTNNADKDIVYWLNKNTMTWQTNLDIYQLPNTVNEFSIREFNLKYNEKPWWKSDAKLDTAYFSKKFYQAVATPTQARLEGELFRKTVQTELIDRGLSKDGETDLLYLTLKATDAVGHAHGWESEEARLVLEETDRQVGLIIAMMEEEWGKDFALVLTADHGAAPLREFSKGIYLKHEDFIATVQTLLPESARSKESLIRYYTSGMISLNRDVMEKYGISEFSIIQKIKSIEIDGKKFYKKVIRKADILK